MSANVEPRTMTLTACRVAGEVERRLPGRVATADDVDVLALGRGRFGHRRAVTHAGTDQVVEAGHVEPAPRHAGGDDHRPAADDRAV